MLPRFTVLVNQGHMSKYWYFRDGRSNKFTEILEFCRFLSFSAFAKYLSPFAKAQSANAFPALSC